MSLEEWELNVQVENPVDFISLAFHGCELRDIYQAQDLEDYFRMLNEWANLFESGQTLLGKSSSV